MKDEKVIITMMLNFWFNPMHSQIIITITEEVSQISTGRRNCRFGAFNNTGQSDLCTERQIQ
jgi:hypothetical protein